jgi:class 3 adenylate cyclase
VARPAFTRANAAALPWLRAVAFAGVTFLAMRVLGFYPAAVDPLLALAVGALGLLSPSVGVLLFIVATGIPLLAGDILVGALFLVLGFASIQYLGDSQGRVFLVVALGFAATMVHAEWAVAVLAGYLLGASEGAIAAFLACLLIQASGLLFGRESVGALATGGTGAGAVVDLAALKGIASPLGFGWLVPGLARIDPKGFFASVAAVRDVAVFAAQPFLWSGAAALAALLSGRPGDPKRRVRALAGVGAGLAALAVASFAAMALSGGPVAADTLAITAGVSLASAVAFAAIAEWMFPLSPVRTDVAEDEADVDELLRAISSAEEELASKHTLHRAVLITDMKAFSRMTEDLGSKETARLVQRHRDLCLPLIEQAGGHGKSTGGDGLLAAFETPGAAVGAAVAMQRALAAYNAARSGEDEILVRAGIASGEVVLDKGGKPFLGDALNKAARVMSLADGGQVFTTKDDLADTAKADYGAVSHGQFRLKNISQPVEIVEVLWRDDQEARPPHETPTEV